jgi:transcription factor S
MEFCPRCQKVLTYIDGIRYQCPKCGYTKDIPSIEGNAVTAEIMKKELIPISTINFSDSMFQTLSISTMSCPLCTNNKAAYWTRAVGTDDDVEIIKYYRCTQCGHRWHQKE